MSKRFLVVLSVSLLLMVLASSALAETMYVITQDGDPLNVRSQPFISADTLIGSLENHSVVTVLSIDSNGWAKIEFWTENGSMIHAYVSSRYLSYDRDGHYRDEKSYAPLPTAVPKESKDNAMEELNAELKSVKSVPVSFSVLVRPSRATGRVNLRWAPNNKTRAICTYPANYKLTVIAETNNWYQVQDPVQGNVGFISKKLVTVVMPGLEE